MNRAVRAWEVEEYAYHCWLVDGRINGCFFTWSGDADYSYPSDNQKQTAFRYHQKDRKEMTIEPTAKAILSMVADLGYQVTVTANQIGATKENETHIVNGDEKHGLRSIRKTWL